MNLNEASVFVKTKRAAVCPNTAFLEQLAEWQMCKFDLQKRSIVDQKPDSDPVGPSSTSLSKAGKVQGEQEAKEGGNTTQKKEEVAPPSPTSEAVHAALIPLCVNNPSMGKKKMLASSTQIRAGTSETKSFDGTSRLPRLWKTVTELEAEASTEIEAETATEIEAETATETG